MHDNYVLFLTYAAAKIQSTRPNQKNNQIGQLRKQFLATHFEFIARQRRLVSVVMITAAKEEVRYSSKAGTFETEVTKLTEKKFIFIKIFF